MTMKLNLLLVILFFSTLAGDPLSEYQTLEKKYVELLEKIEKYKRTLRQLSKEETSIKQQLRDLRQQKERLSLEISYLSNLQLPQKDNFPLLLSILYPGIREKFLIEQEIIFEIRSRLKKLYELEKKLTASRKELREKERETKQLMNLSKEIAGEIEREKEKKLALLREIFSSPETARKYIAYRNNQLKKITMEIHTEEGIPSLQRLKGKLEPPVEGRIIKRYGSYYDPVAQIDLFSPGVEIETRPFTPVKAIYSGVVEFEGPVQGYDYVVIIKHPGDIFSVYGYLSTPLVKKGDIVDIGEIIGVTADYGERSRLYFEIRKAGTPVDPMKWINFHPAGKK